MSLIQTRLLTGFDDPACPPERWQQLLERGETNVVSLTRGWLKAWWETLGEGQLLLIAAERDGEIVALAPFYADSGMVYFVGVGEADYFDFIGDIGAPGVLPALLQAAQAAAPDFAGMRLYLVPAGSPTSALLTEAAARVRLECTLENQLPAFDVDLVTHCEAIRTSTNRSMLKREDYFRQNGSFAVQRISDAAGLRQFLPEFIAQHIARWEGKGDYRSPLEGAKQRDFLERLAQVAAAEGWLRFTRLEWRGQPLAMGFAYYYRGVHHSGPWSFDVAHGKHCPGHVLLRQSLIAALDEGLLAYDLRGGDDHYKSRLPTREKKTCTWGIYPP